MVPKRLKQARLRAKLTQEQLGILAGIEESSASARMNQYERGAHCPSYELVKIFSQVLNVPACWFYADDDSLADHIMQYHLMHEVRNAEDRES